MKQKILLILFAIIFIAGGAFAQYPCNTDVATSRMIQLHPEILQTQALLEAQIKEGLRKIDYNHFAARTTKTTLSLDDAEWYDIPIVVHIIHDYGAEDLSDDAIVSAFNSWNITYAEKNADTGDVIAPFKKYVGNPRIRLHFATKDPNGNPTKGITRYRSYLTRNGSDYSKFDPWPDQAYVNIWFINTFGLADAGFAAYAYQPPTAASVPYYDGVIALYSYAPNDAGADNGGKCINHEIGHVFNLMHPWGNTNVPDVECGDDDVDDTPPTKGHNPVGCVPTALYDTTCASGYYKVYPSSISGLDSLVDYPDTVNSQNIMDYTYCAKMFTKGQVYRMHAAMQSDVAGRDNLWSDSNLVVTGALAPMPDLPMIPDFSVSYVTAASISTNNFVCPGVSIKFTNQSWNDTLVSTSWTFSNGASTPTSTNNTSVTESFTQPGWVTLNLSVTGNHTATSTLVDSQAVFVANTDATNPLGYFQEFNPKDDLAQWPIFNYYNNNFKWQIANVGYYDNYSMEYTGFDTRSFPDNVTGEPIGDLDDFFSIPFDLSAYPANTPLNLDFMYSGATRTAYSPDMNDTLEIDYSVNHAANWTALKILTKTDMINKGVSAISYAPLSQADWSPETISVPAAARNAYTLFRFRYRPGGQAAGYATSEPYSTGNNYYIDRLTISQNTAAVNNVMPADNNIAVVPNPTNGAAYIVIKDADNAMADIRVTDITGKTVYTTRQQISGVTRIEIPQTYISVKGMYLVQVVTGNQSHTEKLVVY